MFLEKKKIKSCPEFVIIVPPARVFYVFVSKIDQQMHNMAQSFKDRLAHVHTIYKIIFKNGGN